MSTIASRTFAQACTDAAALLNDSAQEVYTTALLMPMAALTYLEIQQAFEIDEIPFGETIVTLDDYVANASTIVLSAGAALTDFQEPIEIWQRAVNSTEEWTPILRVARLPAPPSTAPQAISEWEWSEGVIKVNPCSLNRDIRCRYIKQLAYATSGVAVGVEDFYLPMVKGTAAKAAKATGRDDLHAQYQAEYLMDRESAGIQAVKNRQVIRNTRRPYRPGW